MRCPRLSSLNELDERWFLRKFIIQWVEKRLMKMEFLDNKRDWWVWRTFCRQIQVVIVWNYKSIHLKQKILHRLALLSSGILAAKDLLCIWRQSYIYFHLLVCSAANDFMVLFSIQCLAFIKDIKLPNKMSESIQYSSNIYISNMLGKVKNMYWISDSNILYI